ncbi:heme exporter protein A [Sinobacterium caligoides]|uniref:Heme exporter protein A n=1 Tax=Sinobacterium caligoides TaxID=933926 RepID=A0A3N2DXT8_9GAMM|nr:cytochrome c biogenesis heme-transporting ATPase CcmA [Sinobacterium caligoides]ROS04676.1 heme exporter protein A [Sinobacterium caligoides]
MSSPLLEVKGLTGGWFDRDLFNDLSFSVSRAEILQVEGANGTGKTTLLRILAMLSARYTGELLFDGENVRKTRQYYQRNMVFMGHAAGNQAILSPMENLRWYFSSREAFSDQQLMKALDEVGLYGFEDSPCHSLSAGQQRRVSLARLHLSSAPLWILDEPFTAIDKQGVAELEQFIAGHAERGGAVVLTTHHQLDISRQVTALKLGGSL